MATSLDALAELHGGVPAVDYDSLAKQFGGIPVASSYDMSQAPGAVPGTPAPSDIKRPVSPTPQVFQEPGAAVGLGAVPMSGELASKEVDALSGRRGYPEMAAGLNKLVPPSTQPNPTAKEAEVGATQVLRGAGRAATPLMVVGSILQPEAALIAGAGAMAGGAGAKKLAEVVHASPEVRDLAEQAGQIAGGFAGGAAFGGLKHLSNPENALADLLWKRGYIQDGDGKPIYIASQEHAHAVAQEIIKQNPQGIIGSAITKYKAGQAAENVRPRQDMGVAEPAPPQAALPESVDQKPVHHASNDVEDLRASAERQAPKVGDAVANAVEPVPGAKVEAVRDAKDTDRITDKANRQGVQPSQIADISGAKVSVPDQQAATEVLQNLHQQMPVEEAHGTVTGKPQNNDIRQVQAVVDTNAPAQEPLRKAEVILQTPEMHAASEANHDEYREAQDLRAQGKEAEAAQLEQKIATEHEAAEQAARSRQEGTNAIRKPSGTGVGKRQQEEVSESGNGRRSLEQGNQRQEATAPRPPAAPLHEIAAQLEAKLNTGAPRAPKPPGTQENFKGKAVEVKDASGQWKPGKVLNDSISDAPQADRNRRLRGVYDDGSKFDNVEAANVRKPSTVVPKESTSAKKPDIGVDFDGTLFTENSDGSIGKPIPERIASLKEMIAGGKSVIIESRRVKDRPEEVGKIQDALEAAGLPRLPVTDEKVAPVLIDDSVISVPTNANTPLPNVAARQPGEAPVPPGSRGGGEVERPKVSAQPVSVPAISAPKPVAVAKKTEKVGTSTPVQSEVPPGAGLDQGKVQPVEEKPFKYRSTQVNIPETSEASHALNAARDRIPSTDLAGKGKDVGGNHLTVKYGLKAEDDDKLEKLRTYIAGLAPFEATLGKTEMFPPTEHSEGAAVIQAPVNAPELHKINAELEKHGDFKASDFGEYKPHATVAYVDPAKAQRYLGMSVTEGKKFPVNSISVTDREGKQEEIALEGKKVVERPVGSAPATPRDLDNIKARIAQLEAKQVPRAPKPPSPEGTTYQVRAKEIANRLRSVADRMDAQIDDKRREMTQNPTPKRMAEYRSRIIEADEMERTQKAMRALADAHEAGTVPPELAALRSKDEIGRLVHKGLDSSKGGYYDRIPRQDYYDKSPAGKKLQEMIEGAKSPEATAAKLAKEKASKISQLEADVQFRPLPGYFPTPKAVVTKMLDAADIKPGMSVLEPSAGKGNIADAIKDSIPDAKLSVVEQSPKLQEILKLKDHSLVDSDFLQHDAHYDRIVMNPPFEKGADVEHVRHAYELLKPGGRLVAIMSPHAEFASDKKSVDFREWVDSLGGESEKLPEGSFKESGTGVASRMVVIDKDEDADTEAHKDAFNLAKKQLDPDAKWGDILKLAAKIQQEGRTVSTP